jgi:hypothetical protein
MTASLRDGDDTLMGLVDAVTPDASVRWESLRAAQLLRLDIM